MTFSRPTDRLSLTWTVPTGTPKTGYGVANLNTTLRTVDPSNPLWIDETTIRLVADQGSAIEVTAVAILNHDFQEDLELRFQMNATNVWTGPPTVNEVMTVKAPYRNGYACDIFLNLADAIPLAATRTLRWLSITNVDEANDRSVFIGEIWVAGVDGWRQLEPCDIKHEYGRGYGQNLSRGDSKKAVQTVYDWGTRKRRTQDSIVGTEADGVEQLLDWHEDTHFGALPSVAILDEDSDFRRDSEPRLIRLKEVIAPQSVMHKVWYEVPLVYEEYGYGELIGA